MGGTFSKDCLATVKVTLDRLGTHLSFKLSSRLLQTMKMKTAIIIMMIKNVNFKNLSYSSHFKNDFLIPIL